MFGGSLKAAFAACLLVTGFGAQAATIDVGVGGGADCTFWCVDRYQQLYDASIFSGPATITSVSFFAATLNGSAWNGVSSWQMSLSTTSVALGGMSATFNSNVGGDVAVFDSETFSGTPNDGDPTTFTGSFAYDPGMGNLLIDIIRTAGIAQGVGSDAGVNPTLFDRAYAFNSTTTADGVNQGGYANRTRFGLNELVAAPEPATLALFGIALAGIGAMRRRR